MAALIEELKSAGVYPTGPCSAWPQERNKDLIAKANGERPFNDDEQASSAPGPRQLAKNLARTAGQAMRHGKVSGEVRKERYDMCKACPAFNATSRRCKDCGCFMEAKTWIGGNPDKLCPRQKWSR